MDGVWIEYRGVRARVRIEDSADVPEKYVTVSVEVEGSRIAGTDSQGQSYGPIWSTDARAENKT